MSDCAERFRDLVSTVEAVLDEDLPALRRESDRARIERYNDLKAREEQFLTEFVSDCPAFLTDTERDRVRGKFRLARLLVAASFYSENGTVPPTLSGEFVEPELEAVVEFDRYRQFDALSESQIEEKIRRMEGEVYELVEEYTSTQLSTLEQLLEHPDVQRDLMERLLERYESRREKIRRGFFTYVETHGLEHMVGAIEDAIQAVDTARTERQEVQTAIREDDDVVSENVVATRHRLDSEIRQVERELAGGTEPAESHQQELERLEARVDAMVDDQEAATAAIESRLDRTAQLEDRLETQEQALEATRERATTGAGNSTEETVSKLVGPELEQLRETRARIRKQQRRLERERETRAVTRETLRERQERLENRYPREQQAEEGNSGVDGADVVTAEMARILEMDYLGRFDISMHETDAIVTEDGPFEVPDEYWTNRSRRRNNRGYLLDILDSGNPDQYPVNAASRYEVTSSGVFGLTTETELVIEARVLSNLHAHATNGFAEEPMDLDALLETVNEVVAETAESDATYLLGLASPTGWSDRVRSRIEDDEFAKTRFSRHVGICLISLQDGSLIYDDSDPLVCENSDLFAPPVDAERVEACVETIRAQYRDDVGHESVLLRDIVDEHGYDSDVVKRAFNTLEENGDGEQLYLDDLGLSLSFG